MTKRVKPTGGHALGPIDPGMRVVFDGNDIIVHVEPTGGYTRVIVAVGYLCEGDTSAHLAYAEALPGWLRDSVARAVAQMLRVFAQEGGPK